jgi:hypothetical protein
MSASLLNNSKQSIEFSVTTRLFEVNPFAPDAPGVYIDESGSALQ